jgi:hypothetical protein
MDSPKTGNWVYKIKKELNRLSVVWIGNGIYGIINTKAYNNEVQNMLARILWMSSLTFYSNGADRNTKNSVKGMRSEVWKLQRTVSHAQ